MSVIMDKDIIAFVQNKKDNVATVLEDVEKGYIIYLKGGKRGNLIALEKIPKGHKIAISQIKKDELVIKYGESTITILRVLKDNMERYI